MASLYQSISKPFSLALHHSDGQQDPHTASPSPVPQWKSSIPSLLVCFYINYGTTRAVPAAQPLHLSLHKNNMLLAPQANQLLRLSWKHCLHYYYGGLHTLDNVFLIQL